MKTPFFALLTLLTALAVAPAPAQTETPATPEGAEEPAAAASEDEASIEKISVILKTEKGDIKGEIYGEKTPITAANFLNLARHDYYDGLTFHRVISDFMIQGGDPEGTGRGGPGYMIQDEFDPSLRHDKPGVFSMAKTAMPNTGGSQFFITHVPTPHLDNKHSVFGQVTEGQDVVDSIRKGDKIEDIEILDMAAAEKLFEQQSEKIATWNATLKEKGFIE